MDRTRRITVLAQQVAAVLPGPPPVDDREGAWAWAELVGDTVERLAGIAGTQVCPDVDVLPRRALSAEELLVLAGVPVFENLDWRHVSTPGAILP